MRGLTVFLVFMLSYFSSFAASTLDVPGIIRDNNEAVQKIVDEEPNAAYYLLLGALSKDPFNPLLRLNLGVTFEVREEFDKAYKEYMSAYRYAPNDEIKFNALFNAGNAAAAEKKISKALEVYQKALEIDPNSQEVKINIEMLWQQQGGGGEGDQQQDQPNQDPGDGQDQQPQQKEQPKKKEFDSKKLTAKDVRKILEELKNQEQQIRRKEYEKGAKIPPKDKDW